jgi:hypothetical protein
LSGSEIDHVLKVLNVKNTFNNNLIITNDNSFFDASNNTSMNSDNNSDMDTTLVTDS